MRELTIIKNKIFEIRGQRVMLDFDLAELYEVETRTAKTCRKTQYDTLSTDFMFELIEEDAVLLRCQIGTLKSDEGQRTGMGQHSNYMPFAFTEQGVAQKSSVINSRKVKDINIDIIRASVALRRYALGYTELNQKLRKS